ncbi:MAG: hypothetical protein MZU97_22110 [Bacillus subtilis]|nr:hypothetical protein [Bacillus subtilis]
MPDLSAFPQPHTFRLSAGFYIAYFGLLLACVVLVIATAKTFLGLVVDEFGQPLGNDEMTLTALTAIVGLTWLSSLWVLTRQLVVHRSAFRISSEGLHNLTVGGIFLAFVVVMPIRFIPWEYVVVDSRSPLPSIRIRNEYYREFPLVIRWLLRVFGLRLSFYYSKMDSTWTAFVVDQLSKVSEMNPTQGNT